jgi:hypothetical protein
MVIGLKMFVTGLVLLGLGGTLSRLCDTEWQADPLQVVAITLAGSGLVLMAGTVVPLLIWVWTR